GAIRAHRLDERRCKTAPHGILSVAPRAVHLEHLPPIVHNGVDGAVIDRVGKRIANSYARLTTAFTAPITLYCARSGGRRQHGRHEYGCDWYPFAHCVGLGSGSNGTPKSRRIASMSDRRRSSAAFSVSRKPRSVRRTPIVTAYVNG